jgi:diguanylate cyclase (GGDEF)-like protein
VGLKLKLSFFIGLFVVLTSGLVGYVSLTNEEEFLREDVAAKGRQTLTALAVPCGVALANREIDQLDTYLARLSEGDARDLDIEWVAVLDLDGRILAHTDERRFREVLADAFTARALKATAGVSEWDYSERRLHVALPVAIEGLRFGTLRADLSLARLDARIDSVRWRVIGWIALAAALAVFELGFMLTRVVIRPVRNLSEAATRLGQGDLSARAEELKSKDELGLLARVFNSMAASLAAQTADLERRVEERTRELKAANEQLARLATTDELTGLFNHRYFQETLRFEAMRAERKTGALSLLMIDVDNFKRFNDTHGHPAGDALLREIALCFRRHLRTIDIVARYGGEEFAVILLDTPKAAAAQVAEKLRAEISAAPFPNRETQPGGHVSISVGVASLPGDAQTPPELVAAADAALYAAKRGGRDRVALAGG